MDHLLKIFTVISLVCQSAKAILWTNVMPIVNDPNQSTGAGQVPCGAEVAVRDGMSYMIASPGYPRPYSPFVSCRWNFYSPSNQPLTIDCPVFQVAPSSQCSSGSFLAMYPGEQQISWYCGNSGPRSITSKSNYLSLYFWSSWQNTNNYQGFYCTIRASSTSGDNPNISNCRCGKKMPQNRVVGGTDAGLHEYPWMALLLYPNSNGLCGGALINERFVLTAGHCIGESALPNNALPKVVLGEHRLSTTEESRFTVTMNAKAVWPHEKYNKSQGISVKDYDIGLVELESAIDFSASSYIAPICAPDSLESYDDVMATVTGWGYTSFPGRRADVLQEADLEIIPLSTCKSDYPAGIITNKMLCAHAQGKDACFDDSGSPLITKAGDNWVIIGVVSFGPETCADQSIRGVYSRVGEYIPWIRSKVGNARTCRP